MSDKARASNVGKTTAPGGEGDYQFGNFATELTLIVGPGQRADLKVGLGTVNGLTFEADLRNGDTLSGVPLDLAPPSFDGRAFRRITLSALDGNVLWSLVPWDAPPTWTQSPVLAQPNGVLYDAKEIHYVSIPNGTADDTLQQGGGATIPQGAIVRAWGVAHNNGLTTSADEKVEVAIIGHTSSFHYLVAPIGKSLAREFRMKQAEKLDIVAGNNDTAAHVVSAGFEAWSQ